MQRTLYAYKIEPIAISEKNRMVVENIEEDICYIVKELCEKDLLERKRDFRTDKKVLYLDSFQYDSKMHIINLKFIYLKYDSRRRVVDTQTLSDKGILKGRDDGDEEKNHVCLKFVDNNEIVALYEYNSLGIGFRRIIDYFQHYLRLYLKSMEKSEERYSYKLMYEHIVSKDFLKALSGVKKVKAITLTVEQKDKSISEFKDLSGKGDISSEVDVLFKPVSSVLGIHKDTVKEFFKIYNSKERDVKRVTIKGAGEVNEDIKFDTDSMKQKLVVQVEETPDTREVDSSNMFNILFAEILSL